MKDDCSHHQISSDRSLAIYQYQYLQSKFCNFHLEENFQHFFFHVIVGKLKIILTFSHECSHTVKEKLRVKLWGYNSNSDPGSKADLSFVWVSMELRVTPLLASFPWAFDHLAMKHCAIAIAMWCRPLKLETFDYPSVVYFFATITKQSNVFLFVRHQMVSISKGTNDEANPSSKPRYQSCMIAVNKNVQFCFNLPKFANPKVTAKICYIIVLRMQSYPHLSLALDISFISCSKIFKQERVKALVQKLRQDTHVQQVEVSNPGTGYYTDICSH